MWIAVNRLVAMAGVTGTPERRSAARRPSRRWRPPRDRPSSRAVAPVVGMVIDVHDPARRRARARSMSPSVRSGFGQSVSTTTSKRPVDAVPAPGSARRRGGSRATAGAGCGPAVDHLPAARLQGRARGASSVPSTSASGWTCPSISAPGPACAGRSGAGPSSGHRRRVTPAARRSRRPAEQRLDVGGVLHGAVGPEVELGRHAQVEVAAAASCR